MRIICKYLKWLLLAVYLHAQPIYAELLPVPLTLDKALMLADANHPQLVLADADLAYAISQRAEIGSNNDIDANLVITPLIAKPTTGDKFLGDSYLRLSLTKTLYDFGYSDNLEVSADQSILSRELLASVARNNRYLDIMHLYFDVILADLYFAAVDEEMTVLYVSYDKVRERHSLDMVSEVALAEAESRYREVADSRKQGEIEQQLSRLRLAIALNRPDDIPGDLVRPELPQLQRDMPEVSTLLQTALSNNLTLTALEHAMLADKAAVKASQQQLGPTLSAAVELSEYERALSGRNNAGFGVSLKIPLLNGGRTEAGIARATARLSTSTANYDLAKYTIRQKLSDLVKRLELLQYKRTTDERRLDSRALTLDKARARYELELQTTLGDTMAKYTHAEWLSAKNDFELAQTWAQIDILTGKKLYQKMEN